MTQAEDEVFMEWANGRPKARHGRRKSAAAGQGILETRRDIADF
jgi:hypothetical protein